MLKHLGNVNVQALCCRGFSSTKIFYHTLNFNANSLKFFGNTNAFRYKLNRSYAHFYYLT